MLNLLFNILHFHYASAQLKRKSVLIIQIQIHACDFHPFFLSFLKFNIKFNAFEFSMKYIINNSTRVHRKKRV